MRNLAEHARLTRLAWLEYCVASQYGKSWDVVEDVLALRYVLSDTSPPPEAHDAMKSDRSAASPRWIFNHACGPPPGWITAEIGRPGDNPSIWATAASLDTDNAKRRKAFEKTEAELRQAAKHGA